MITDLQDTWSSWSELSKKQQSVALASLDFWSKLSDSQRRSFVETADWPQLRRVGPAKEARLAALVPIQAAAEALGLSADAIYWLITTRELPAWLVDGQWKLELRAVDRWLEARGAREKVLADLERRTTETSRPA